MVIRRLHNALHLAQCEVSRVPFHRRGFDSPRTLMMVKLLRFNSSLTGCEIHCILKLFAFFIINLLKYG